MKVRIGIDIGSEGAYAVFLDSTLKTYGKIPYTTEEQNVAELLNHICDVVPKDSHDIHVVIEDLHSIHKSSAKSNFEFGKNNGLIIGMLQVIGFPYTKIGPKKWQKEMWQGIRPVEIPVKGELDKEGNQKYKVDTKATSLIAAQRLYPGYTFLATERSRVPHNGIVDAVLIGAYGTRKL